MDLLNSELEFFLLCLSILFPLVNPLGITPIFLSMTEEYDQKDRVLIAKRGAMIGTFTLIIFALFGSVIFTFSVLFLMVIAVQFVNNGVTAVFTVLH